MTTAPPKGPAEAPPVTSDAVRAALAGVMLPASGGALAQSGRLSDILVQAGAVTFSITIAPREAAAFESIRQVAEARVAALPGVARVRAVLTSDDAAATAPSPPPAPKSGAAEGITRLPSLAAIKHIIAVASGKGGVGKSTTAANLALALAAADGSPVRPLRVGVLDADIYGPSMPKLFALKGQPRILAGRTLAPLEGYGLKVMSIGFLVDPAKAMIWRGPMVASAVTQMLRDVAWGELDVLVVDMPPGTGDAQLSLAQTAPLSGAVIVSTPQDLALIDARRGVAMFQDIGVPILGLIENMSYFVCDDCGKRHHIFANGGARTEAERLGVPFLGEIPLDPLIRERSDAGLPVVVAEPDSAAAQAYRAIAANVRRALGLL
ncbi:MAG: P-loop NTPase [Hyphomicrobiaceae bacterium]